MKGPMNTRETSPYQLADKLEAFRISFVHRYPCSSGSLLRIGIQKS